MLDGRITQFLRHCLCSDECFYNDDLHRYEFCLANDALEDVVMFVYPKTRRVRFLQTVEVWKGNGYFFGFEEDIYETVVRSDDDRANLSSEEAARMIFAKLVAHDFDGVVSKQSLALLKQN